MSQGAVLEGVREFGEQVQLDYKGVVLFHSQAVLHKSRPRVSCQRVIFIINITSISKALYIISV